MTHLARWETLLVALLVGVVLYNSHLSPYFLDMTPYLLTLVGLLLMGRARRHAMPEGLRAVFEGVT